MWIEEAIPGTIPAMFFPFLVSCALSVLCLALVIISARGVYLAYAGGKNRERQNLEAGASHSGRFLALFAYMGILFAYLAGLDYIGFVYSTPIAMLLISLLLGLRRWLAGFICYCVFAVVLNWATFHFMRIILPQGLLWQ